MKRTLFGWVSCFVISMGTAAFAADDDGKKGESAGKKPTAQEREVEAAEELLDKLSSTNKGKLTRLINSGSLKEIMALPGIGRVTAELIIEARPLKSTAHIVEVKNIGLKTMEKVVDFVDKGGLNASSSSTKSKSKSTKSKS